MQKLLTHIEYLVWHHDCVIVPGFGAFVAYERPAEFDERMGCVFPPRREISFNADIANNDGLLANSIARRDAVSFEEAAGNLAHLTDELRETLSRGETVTVGQIGNLTGESDGRVTFSPLSTPEEDAARLGFYPVTLRSHIKEEERRPEVSISHDDRYINLRLSKRVMKIAAAVAVVFIAGISLMISTDIPKNVDMASVFPAALRQEVEKPSPKPVKIVVPAKRESKKAPDKAVSVKTVPAKAVAPEKIDTGEYCLVVATLRTQKEVDTFLSQHKGGKFSLSMVQTGSTRRIIARRAEKKERLLEYVNSREFTKEFPGAWIWHEKK